MEWIRLNTDVIDSEAFAGAEPVDRGIWLCLLRYCCEKENGGVIHGARTWDDCHWLQMCHVSLKEVQRDTQLWHWFGDDLQISFYPIEEQREI